MRIAGIVLGVIASAFFGTATHDKKTVVDLPPTYAEVTHNQLAGDSHYSWNIPAFPNSQVYFRPRELGLYDGATLTVTECAASTKPKRVYENKYHRGFVVSSTGCLSVSLITNPNPTSLSSITFMYHSRSRNYKDEVMPCTLARMGERSCRRLSNRRIAVGLKACHYYTEKRYRSLRRRIVRIGCESEDYCHFDNPEQCDARSYCERVKGLCFNRPAPHVEVVADCFKPGRPREECDPDYCAYYEFDLPNLNTKTTKHKLSYGCQNIGFCDFTAVPQSYQTKPLDAQKLGCDLHDHCYWDDIVDACHSNFNLTTNSTVTCPTQSLTSLGDDVLQVAAGHGHSCAVLTGGILYCWGGGSSDGSIEGSIVALQVELGSCRTVKQVAAGTYHTCVLLDNDQVKCFGVNRNGQLGLGYKDMRGVSANEAGEFLPYVDVGTNRTVKQVAAGGAHTCVLLDNSQVKCFGTNFGTQIGDNLLALDIGTGRTVKQVAAGKYYTCVILDNDRVKCFGSKRFGYRADQMGDNLPYVHVGTGRTVKQVAVGDEHTCVLLDNDQVKCFGDNEYGQLGLGDTNSRGRYVDEMGDNLPYADFGAGRTVKQVAAGSFHTCVFLDNDQVKCFGKNYGRLGLDDTNNKGDDANEMGENLPYMDVGNGRTVKHVAAGGGHTCVILDNREVKCCGSNGSGELGLGHTRRIRDGLNKMGDGLLYVNFDIRRTVKHVAAGVSHTCVVLDNDQVKCFGRNKYGELGLGDTRNRGFDVNEMGDNLPYMHVGTGRTVKQVAVGNFHTCVLLDNDQVKCFGFNDHGQLGFHGYAYSIGGDVNELGDNLPYVRVGTGRTVKQVAVGDHHTCVLLDNDQVKCFGYNRYGQLGLGDREDRGDDVKEMGKNLPYVDVGTGRTVKQVAAGVSHTCVLLDNDQVKCFGENFGGGLGLGDSNSRGDDPNEMGDNLPYVDVGTGRTVKQVAVGNLHTCVLLDNDQVKCFGYNNIFGQLGLGDTNSRGDDPNEMGDNLPYVDVGTGRTVRQVSVGSRHTCVLLDNDQVKCFGKNDGALGLGDTNNRGDDANGMGDNLPYVDVGTGRTVKQVTAGNEHTCVLLDNDQVKCFGRNRFGELGPGSRLKLVPPSFPLFFGFVNKILLGSTLPDMVTGRPVKQVAAGYFRTCVLLDNDQVKCFGRSGLYSNSVIGDDANEMGEFLPYLDVGAGRKVKQVVDSCAILDNDQVKCFGFNKYGQLGLGDTEDRDFAYEMGDNLPYVDVGFSQLSSETAAACDLLTPAAPSMETVLPDAGATKDAIILPCKASLSQ